MNVVPLRREASESAGGGDAPFDAPVPTDPPHDTGGGPPGGGGASDEPEEPTFGRVIPLGTATLRGKTAYVLLDAAGARGTYSARDLHSIGDVSGLFGGSSAKTFLARRWPYLVARRDVQGKIVRDDKGRPEMVPSGDFSARDLGDALMAACTRLGPADALEHRRDGIWPGEGGGLAVHAGNAIHTWPQDQSHAPGWRLGSSLHVAARPRPKGWPARAPATAAQMHAMQRDFDLWSYATAMERSASALLTGMVAVGIYAGALTTWRPHMWLRGDAGIGKSHLLDLVVALTGADRRSKDVSEAFVRDNFDARSGLIVLDEENANLAGVTEVLRLMRGASDGEGARTGRMYEGAARVFRVACPFLLAANSMPAFEPADASRITTLTLRRGDGGDRSARVNAAIAAAADLHPAIVTRLVQGWHRFRQNVEVFRAGLMQRHATARCADQLGTLLAGWRTLIDDEVVDPFVAAEDLNSLEIQVVTPDAAAESDAWAQVIAHLLSSRMPTGTGRESNTVAGLVELLREAVTAWQWAMSHGTPVEQVEFKTQLARIVGDAGALQLRWSADPPGLLVGNTSPLLNRAFDGTAWANRVWLQALRDAPGAEDAGAVNFRRASKARAVLLPEPVLGLIPCAWRPPGGPEPPKGGAGP